jgi:predicted dehydrogenase
LRPPRLGFAGIGWIGLSRLRSVAQSGAARPAVLYDLDPERLRRAFEIAPAAAPATSFEALLDAELDGIVIATPNAAHEAQSLAALRRGIAVFCQKPLALNAAGARRIVDAARMSNLPLAVDFCYRYTAAASAAKTLIENRELGEIYAAELMFHNAYGPDKQWYYDGSRSGGGCVLDLGIHLVDLALWLLDDFAVRDVTSRLHRPLETGAGGVEDYASIQFTAQAGVSVNIVCSWRLQTAGDAKIFAGLYGTKGGVELRNVNGSFYDFSAVHISGGRAVTIASPPDDWSGRAIADWISALGGRGGFDPAAQRIIDVSQVVDRVYHG